MDSAKTGLMSGWRIAPPRVSGVRDRAPAGAQTILFQEPEITVVASEGNIDRMKDLIQQRTHLDKQDSKGRTALVTGTIAGEVDIVDMLLDAGARTDVADKLGNYGAELGRSQGEYDIADMLVGAGAT